MVRLAGTIHRYIGSSQEVKPHVGQRDVATGVELLASDLPIGSTYLEEDTGLGFVYNGETWEPDIPTVQALIIVDRLGGLLKDMLDETRAQTKILESMASDPSEEEAQ